MCHSKSRQVVFFILVVRIIYNTHLIYFNQFSFDRENSIGKSIDLMFAVPSQGFNNMRLNFLVHPFNKDSLELVRIA